MIFAVVISITLLAKEHNHLPENGVVDDADHSFFCCAGWNGIRQKLDADTEEISPGSGVREILRTLADGVVLRITLRFFF